MKNLLKEVNILYNESLAKYTSFKIGGIADILYVPKDVEELSLIYKKCKGNNILILGGGCNILVSDEGFRGIVFKIKDALTNFLVEDNIIDIMAGVSLSKLANIAAENNFTGFEPIAGIPGTIGGAIFMNAGAYGGEISDFLMSVDYMDENGDIHTLDKKDINFSYRYSIFKDNPKWIILSAKFLCKQGNKDDIVHLMRELGKKRADKQPLEYPSAGSTFKRPIGGYASALIEDAGLKGLSVGGAMVSEKHSGFIINKGSATCSDVLALIDEVQKKVYNKFNIQLECEVRIV